MCDGAATTKHKMVCCELFEIIDTALPKDYPSKATDINLLFRVITPIYEDRTFIMEASGSEMISLAN